MKYLLTLYILIWPVISVGVLTVLIVSLFKDMRAARRDGKSMV